MQAIDGDVIPKRMSNPYLFVRQCYGTEQPESELHILGITIKMPDVLRENDKAELRFEGDNCKNQEVLQSLLE